MGFRRGLCNRCCVRRTPLCPSPCTTALRGVAVLHRILLPKEIKMLFILYTEGRGTKTISQLSKITCVHATMCNDRHYLHDAGKGALMRSYKTCFVLKMQQNPSLKLQRATWDSSLFVWFHEVFEQIAASLLTYYKSYVKATIARVSSALSPHKKLKERELG